MNYHNLTYPDMNNGEGLRVVLWLSGCSHKCKGCQNPQTWNANSGIPFDEQAKEELFRELDKDYISGLTLTGGDPLFENNLNDVLDLVNEFRLSCPQKSIWLYTGFTWEDIWEPGIHGTDLYGKPWNSYSIFQIRIQNIVKQCNILVDGQYIDSQRDITLPYRGSRNQRLIDVMKSLRKGEIVLWKC